MYDTGKVIGGLAVFVGIALLPVWLGAFGEAPSAPDPKIVTEEKECVRPRLEMRAAHMDVLNQWRDNVVRDGVRTIETAAGREMEMSLSGTCMSCHPNKEEFCDSCHNYLAVSPYCWDCHVEPKKNGEMT